MLSYILPIEIDFIYMEKLNFVACHRDPERSFFYKGKQFPMCARCTGIYLGFLIMPFTLFNLIQLGLVLSSLLILPTILDGFIQSQTPYRSNNILRLFTGTLGGVGLIGVSTVFAEFLSNLIF